MIQMNTLVNEFPILTALRFSNQSLNFVGDILDFFSHFRAPSQAFWHWIDTMAIICGNQILAYVLYESLSVPIFFGMESFPFQIFFGTESDSYITKCLISVQHSSSLISSIKKRNLYILKEIHCHSRDLNPGPLTSQFSAHPIELSRDG